MKQVSLLSVCAVAVLALGTGCKKLPGGLGGLPGGSSKVDPNTCGNYAVSDAGRKLQNFLQATVELEERVTEVTRPLRTSCETMGRKIGMMDAEFKGETKDVCAAVYGKIRENLKVSIKSQEALVVKFKPAVCRANIDAAAEAAASCEGKARADISATCSGTCKGTCGGTCAGQCNGKNSSGQCNGECNGQCSGSCSGGCDGDANVEASMECKAKASVRASIDVQCDPPQLSIDVQKPMIIDSSKAEATLAALREGLPEIFSIEARLRPLKGAVTVWSASAGALASSASELAGSFKDQALCIAGQLRAAASMVGNIKAEVNVSVEVSASAHGTIGG